ncbi:MULTISPECIES: 1-phosphofructokinase family hexose kinase [unclassified Arthrobacter]|uniref:1-phosphofructokinase family hexose kinase n=1 Tax=unclassified Arthrobacter TaxID=235627 RepID=UPI001491CC1F|nr:MULTISPECIES: 1-phosphofructokinase family hexose kinase [unclassified Arthrobacter]MBE0009343.1 1-phosphofructokinase family hexose kinase [Arthrobacter sp. AET 35A]NOJ63178.1 1-phosphofructokinase family hexose kinase [Arthrobacter sp. 147(2020)]
MTGDLRPHGTIITVTANPAVDLTYAVPRLIPGSSHRVRQPLLRAGGKGLNVARVLHQAGYRTVALAPVGGLSGTEFREELVASGVPHMLTPTAAATRRSMAFVDGEAGQTSIFNETGRPLTDTEWEAFSAAFEAQLDGAGALVGSGSLPDGAPVDFYPSLVRRARKHGIPSLIDTSGDALLAAADAGADLLKPNHHELLAATGATTLDDGARQLLDRGAGAVVVSCGEEGMALHRTGSPTLWASLPRVDGNPTGAGDASVAALAVVLASGATGAWDTAASRHRDETLLRLATAWSAAAVLMPAAGELHDSYPELIEAVTITQDRPPSPHAQQEPQP